MGLTLNPELSPWELSLRKILPSSLRSKPHRCLKEPPITRTGIYHKWWPIFDWSSYSHGHTTVWSFTRTECDCEYEINAKSSGSVLRLVHLHLGWRLWGFCWQMFYKSPFWMFSQMTKPFNIATCRTKIQCILNCSVRGGVSHTRTSFWTTSTVKSAVSNNCRRCPKNSSSCVKLVLVLNSSSNTKYICFEQHCSKLIIAKMKFRP